MIVATEDVCVRVHALICTRVFNASAMANVQRSEENFRQLVLAFHHAGFWC